MTTRIPNLNEDQRAAIERLIRIAQGHTGQSCQVANFLLAWWNAEQYGGFDLTDLWNLDRSVADDLLTVVALLTRRPSYPDTIGYGPQFEALIQVWRPTLGNTIEPIQTEN
jgi:hypothetical protein